MIWGQCCKCAIIEASTGDELRWYTSGRKCTGSSKVEDVLKYEENSNYEDSRIGWLLLGTIDALEKDIKKLRVTDPQSNIKCEYQKQSWWHISRLS